MVGLVGTSTVGSSREVRGAGRSGGRSRDVRDAGVGARKGEISFSRRLSRGTMAREWLSDPEGRRSSPGPEGFPERRRDAGAFPRDVDAFSRSDGPDVDRQTDASNRARALRRAFPGAPATQP